MYKYNIHPKSKYKKDYRKLIAQGKDVSKLDLLINELRNKNFQHAYKNHKLEPKSNNIWECHIGSETSDWLLIYTYNDTDLVLILLRTGTHTELLDSLNINKYYRFVLLNNKTNKYESFFIGLGKYLKQLYDEDNEIYDDFNYSLSKLEYKLKVPELDYNNKNYNFAFTKDALNKCKKEIDDLNWYIDEYSPYELIMNEVNLNGKDIIYKDDMQIAYEVNK